MRQIPVHTIRNILQIVAAAEELLEQAVSAHEARIEHALLIEQEALDEVMSDLIDACTRLRDALSNGPRE